MSIFNKLLGKKEKLIRSYTDFWNWFRENEKEFFHAVKDGRNIHADFFDKISQKLDQLKEGYFFLAGMPAPDLVDIIFTADGNLKNIAFVEELVVAAPRLTGWQFNALKPSLDINDVNIEMGGLKFEKSDMHFFSTLHEKYPDEIDITIVYDHRTEDNKDAVANGIYLFLDNYLGELNFATTIDRLTIAGPAGNGQELIPMEKLKDYLVWRQREFLEKYEGIRHNTDKDHYTMFEATLEDNFPLLAVMNEDLIHWDGKASHPWMCNILFRFDGSRNHGLPDDATYELLNNIEDELMLQLKDSDGYLNVGRETAKGEKEIFFACNDFRKPSKLFYSIQEKYSDRFTIEYTIYKDKYWKHLERYSRSSTL